MRPYLRQLGPALRMLVILSVILGVLYPLAVYAIAQVPGLQSRADGSLLHEHGKVVGSALLGQDFAGKRQYFQGRPSASSYDPTASGASNLGPESVVGADSLLSTVCRRSYEIGKRYGVDGSRPFCTSTGVGAVLAVFPDKAVSVNQSCPAIPFVASYQGRPVTCAVKGADYAAGTVVPIRGAAPAHPVVPADAVTASGSGLDPEISPAYAQLQEASVATARGIAFAQVAALVHAYEKGRDLGFLGEPRVNVARLNLALDERYPMR